MKWYEDVNIAKSTVTLAWRGSILHLSEDWEHDILFKDNVQATVTLLALKKICFYPLSFSLESMWCSECYATVKWTCCNVGSSSACVRMCMCVCMHRVWLIAQLCSLLSLLLVNTAVSQHVTDTGAAAQELSFLSLKQRFAFMTDLIWIEIINSIIRMLNY